MDKIIETIIKYNLSVRHIPKVVKNELYGYSDGKRIIKKETIYPKHGGKFMVKSVNNTDTMIRWNLKKDNLADTLKESIELFLKKQTKEKIS